MYETGHMSSLDTARTKSIPDTEGPLRKKSCGSVAYFHVFPYVYVGKHVGKHAGKHAGKR